MRRRCRPRSTPRRVLALTTALLLSAPLVAHADEPASVAAETMFRDGRTLLASGKVREACEKFSESKRLDPAPGTLLNLAQCYETLGRTASAWVNYRELAALATKLGQTRRAEFASGKSAALEPTLPTLLIHVPAEHRVDGLTVEYDGTKLGTAAWDTRVPVDPGRHHIAVSAPGRQPWSAELEAAPGKTSPVNVPQLATGPGAEEPEGPLPPADRPSRTIRTLGIATALVGAVAVGTGLVFGGIAKLENDGAHRDDCAADGCSSAGLARIGRADDFATVSTVVTITGLTLAVVGVALWWFSPPAGARSRTALAPLLSGVAF